MRQTKFRGKRIDTGEWVYGDYFRFFEYHLIRDKDYHDYTIDPETKGEWSGLVDKNGKEIFEGDLGRLHCHEECRGAIGEVGWWNDGWWIMTNRNHAGLDGEYKLRTSEVVQSIDKTGEYSAFEVLTSIHDPNHEELK